MIRIVLLSVLTSFQAFAYTGKDSDAWVDVTFESDCPKNSSLPLPFDLRKWVPIYFKSDFLAVIKNKRFKVSALNIDEGYKDYIVDADIIYSFKGEVKEGVIRYTGYQDINDSINLESCPYIFGLEFENGVYFSQMDPSAFGSFLIEDLDSFVHDVLKIREDLSL